MKDLKIKEKVEIEEEKNSCSHLSLRQTQVVNRNACTEDHCKWCKSSAY